jgi:hypothetical protein
VRYTLLISLTSISNLSFDLGKAEEAGKENANQNKNSSSSSTRSDDGGVPFLNSSLSTEEWESLSDVIEECQTGKKTLFFPKDPQMREHIRQKQLSWFGFKGDQLSTAQLVSKVDFADADTLMLSGAIFFWDHQDRVPPYKFCRQLTKDVWIFPVEYLKMPSTSASSSSTAEVTEERVLEGDHTINVDVCFDCPLFHSLDLDKCDYNLANLILRTDGVVEVHGDITANTRLCMSHNVKDNQGKRERAKLRRIKKVLEFLRLVNFEVTRRRQKVNDKDKDQKKAHIVCETNIDEVLKAVSGVHSVAALQKEKYKNKDCNIVADSVLFFLFASPGLAKVRPVYTRGMLVGPDVVSWPWNVLLFTSVARRFIRNDMSVLQLILDKFVGRLAAMEIRNIFYLPTNSVIDDCSYGHDAEYMLPLAQYSVEGGSLLKSLQEEELDEVVPSSEEESSSEEEDNPSDGDFVDDDADAALKRKRSDGAENKTPPKKKKATLKGSAPNINTSVAAGGGSEEEE